MANSTQRPTVSNKCNSDPDNILNTLSPSPVEFLNRVLDRYPFLELIPNSLLGQAVIAEYNSSIPPGTTRPDWPADLCGYIEGIQDQALRENRGERGDAPIPNNEISGNIDGIPDTKYDQDDCIQPVAEITREFGRFDTPQDVTLAVRQPGTLAYSRDCETENLIEDLYDVDWAGYFNNSRANSYPSRADLTDEEVATLRETYGPLLSALGTASCTESPATTFESSGFLWKPISEGDKKLVILLPGSLRGNVDRCTISGSFGDENGRFTGDDSNGNRPHFRFSRPGAGYGTNITVKAFSGGSLRGTWIIARGECRSTN